MKGDIKEHIALVHEYVNTLLNAQYAWSTVAGMPTLVSTECTKQRKFESINKELFCSKC